MVLKLKNLNSNLYYLIPLTCFFLWALLSLIKDDFIIVSGDYAAFYYAGKSIFSNPEVVYSKQISPRYRYLPSFATIFWIMGLVSAVNGQEKEVPIIGPLAQDWFKGL